MKNWLKVLFALMLVVTCVFSYAACNNNTETPDNGNGSDTENPGGDSSTGDTIKPEGPDDTEFVEDAWQIKFHYSYTAQIVNENDRTENKQADVTVATIYIPYDAEKKGKLTDEDLAKINAISYHGYKFDDWYAEWNKDAKPQVPTGDPYVFAKGAEITGDIHVYAHKGVVAGDNIEWNVEINYETDEAIVPDGVAADAKVVKFVYKTWLDSFTKNATNTVALKSIVFDSSKKWSDFLTEINAIRYDGYKFKWYTADNWDFDNLAPKADAVACTDFAKLEKPNDNIVFYGVLTDNRDDEPQETVKTLVSGVLNIESIPFEGADEKTRYTMYGFDNANPIDVPWYNYKDEITTIVMSDNITNIGKNAFANFTAIKEIDFSDTLETIGETAFYNCGADTSSTFIKTLRLPSSVKTISKQAFANTGIKDLILNDGLETIGDSAFSGASKIASVVIPYSVKEIATGAFYSGSSTTTHLLSRVFYGGDWDGKSEIAEKYYGTKANEDGSNHPVPKFEDIKIGLDNESLAEIATLYQYKEKTSNDTVEGLYWYYHTDNNNVRYPIQYNYALAYKTALSKIPIFTDYVPTSPKMENGVQVVDPVTGVPVFEAKLTDANLKNYADILNAAGIFAKEQSKDENGNLLYVIKNGHILDEKGRLLYTDSQRNVYAKVTDENVTQYVNVDDSSDILKDDSKLTPKMGEIVYVEFKATSGATNYKNVACSSDVRQTLDGLEAKYEALLDLGYGFTKITSAGIQEFIKDAAISGDTSLTCLRGEYPSGSNYSGILGGGVKWELDSTSGTLTIKPGKSNDEDEEDENDENITNIMWDYRTSADIASVWYDNPTKTISVKKIIIEDGVEYIGDYVFSGTGITSVVIPASVKKIAAKAFANCSSLHSIYYMRTEFENPADFAIDTAGTANAVLYLKTEKATASNGSYWWTDADDTVSSLEMPKVAWSLTSNTVKNENGEDITVSDLYIGGDDVMMNFATANDAPWYGAKDNITSVTVANNITSLATNMVLGYKNITSIKLPSALKYIPKTAFAGTAIVDDTPRYPSGMLIIDGHLIKVDPARRNNELFVTTSAITGVIAGGAFSRCDNIKTLFVESAIRYINSDAFAGVELKEIFVNNSSDTWASIAKDFECSTVPKYYSGQWRISSETGKYVSDVCNHYFDASTEWNYAQKKDENGNYIYADADEKLYTNVKNNLGENLYILITEKESENPAFYVHKKDENGRYVYVDGEVENTSRKGNPVYVRSDNSSVTAAANDIIPLYIALADVDKEDAAYIKDVTGIEPVLMIPNCLEGGKRVRYCIFCGVEGQSSSDVDGYEELLADRTKHIYHTENIAATCKDDAKEVKTCTRVIEGADGKEIKCTFNEEKTIDGTKDKHLQDRTLMEVAEDKYKVPETENEYYKSCKDCGEASDVKFTKQDEATQE